MWKFVGTLGGQNAYECSECGTVCAESGRLTHDRWHDEQGGPQSGQQPLFRIAPRSV